MQIKKGNPSFGAKNNECTVRPSTHILTVSLCGNHWMYFSCKCTSYTPVCTSTVFYFLCSRTWITLSQGHASNAGITLAAKHKVNVLYSLILNVLMFACVWDTAGPLASTLYPGRWRIKLWTHEVHPTSPDETNQAQNKPLMNVSA